MVAASQQPKGQDATISALNLAIDGLNILKEVSSIEPIKTVFGSVIALLTMIRDSMTNERGYIDIGLSCANICNALHRGMNGKKLEDLSQPVREAINHLTTTVEEIRRKAIKRRMRNAVSQLFHAKNDKDRIADWKLELITILQVFTVEVVMNTNGMIADMHRRSAFVDDQGAEDQHPSVVVSCKCF